MNLKSNSSSVIEAQIDQAAAAAAAEIAAKAAASAGNPLSEQVIRQKALTTGSAGWLNKLAG